MTYTKVQSSPGPWVHGGLDYDSIRAHGGVRIYEGLFDGARSLATAWDIQGGVVVANTFLITAAPDLLAACEAAFGAEALGPYTQIMWGSSLRLQLRAAIAKARGKV